MGKIDFAQLADDLDGVDGGPTVAEVTRARRQEELLVQVLQALARPQAAPSVSVSPQVTVPEPTVTVQFTPKPVTRWSFEFVRNADGTIQRVIAQANA
jgi:hypothetical protein